MYSNNNLIGIFLLPVTASLLCLFSVCSNTVDDPTSFERTFIEDDLLIHWAFDDDDGDRANDSSFNNNDATINGASKAVGTISIGLEFDGVDDYVQIFPPTKLKSLGMGSISVWFKVDHIPTDFGIAPIFYYGAADTCAFLFDSSNQGMILELGHSPLSPGNKKLYFTIFGNECSLPSVCFDSGVDISEGEWHHFVAVVGKDYNTGYLDGAEMVDRHYNFGDSSYSLFFADAVKHERLWIGKGYWDATPMYYDGMIDDIRIYTRPLSAEEIKELYNS